MRIYDPLNKAIQELQANRKISVNSDLQDYTASTNNQKPVIAKSESFNFGTNVSKSKFRSDSQMILQETNKKINFEEPLKTVEY